MIYLTLLLTLLIAAFAGAIILNIVADCKTRSLIDERDNIIVSLKNTLTSFTIDLQTKYIIK